MILYHGSNTAIEQIDLEKSKPNKDFGRGFYLSELEEQALEMMRRANKLAIREYEHGERKNPRLVLNPDKTNFYDMTIDDFTMENYEPSKPQLHLELGI